jgi:hypothetical protein
MRAIFAMITAVAMSVSPAVASEPCTTNQVLLGAAIGAVGIGALAYTSNARHLDAMRTTTGTLANGGTLRLGRTVGESGGWAQFAGTRRIQAAVTGFSATYGALGGAAVACAASTIVYNNDLTWSEFGNMLVFWR